MLSITSMGILGDYTIYTSDFGAQYQNFFNFFRENILTNPKALLINQGFGLGQETFGLFTYYLSSPLNIILLFFPKGNLELSIYVLMLLKLVLGGLAMQKYLQKYELSGILEYLYSIAFVFSGYTMFNFINPIWLDVLYLLPLAMLGLDRLIAKRKKKTFIVFTALMVISNFYIGYMLCLLSALYIGYQILKNKIEKKEINLKHIGMDYFISAIFIGLLSFPTLYLSYLSMVGTKMAVSEGLGFHNFFDTYFNFFEFMSKFSIGSNGVGQLQKGFPNIWLPSLFVLLFVLSLFSKNISKKMKILNFGVLSSLFLIFNVKGLNMIMHGFSEPVWFLYRNSFFFVFLLIMIVADFTQVTKNLSEIKTFKFSYLFVLVLILVNAFGVYTFSEYHLNVIGLIISTVFSVLILGLIKLIVKNKFMISLITTITLIEIFIGGSYMVFTQYITGGIFHREAFQEYEQEIKDVSNKLHDLETSGYRISSNANNTYMEWLPSGFEALRTFSSNNKPKPLINHKPLGVIVQDSSLSYNSRNFFTDFLLSNKYSIVTNNEEFMIRPEDYEQSDKNSIYYKNQETISTDIIDKSNKVGSTKFFDIYENKNILPKIYLHKNNKPLFENLSSDFGEVVNNSNKVFKRFFDVGSEIFQSLEMELQTKDYLSNKKLTKKETLSSNVFQFDKKGDLNTVTYSIFSDKEQTGYINSVLAYNGSIVSKQKNAEVTSRFNGVNVPHSGAEFQMIPVTFKKGENILEFTVDNSGKFENKDNEYLYTPYAYTIKETLLDYEIEKYFSTAKVAIESNGTDRMDVTIVTKGQNNHLNSTIPYDKFWKASSSGKPLKVSEVDSYLSVDISELSDGDVVTYHYNIPLLPIFFIISIISWCNVIVLVDNNRYLKVFLK